MEATSNAVQTRLLGEVLLQLKRQFDQWRAGRKVGERISLDFCGPAPSPQPSSTVRTAWRPSCTWITPYLCVEPHWPVARRRPPSGRRG